MPAPGERTRSWDDLEVWFDKGVTDGLPVIPPSRERVERMLGGTTRDRQELRREGARIAPVTSSGVEAGVPQ